MVIIGIVKDKIFHRRDAENAEYHREEKRRKHKILLSSCSLCDLCASAVKTLQCLIIQARNGNENYQFFNKWRT